eukprot:TRINITY_DN22981_c0_g1_i1.p1 TRINITY_DN22981_c0_g1~~TRINITY_DN22981_c0_g1_i1.p1  ORF type:complete len:586 (-),score=79.28 TRINITY_DN22981_c0_g1_i1:198-1955(-)
MAALSSARGGARRSSPDARPGQGDLLAARRVAEYNAEAMALRAKRPAIRLAGQSFDSSSVADLFGGHGQASGRTSSRSPSCGVDAARPASGRAAEQRHRQTGPGRDSTPMRQLLQQDASCSPRYQPHASKRGNFYAASAASTSEGSDAGSSSSAGQKALSHGTPSPSASQSLAKRLTGNPSAQELATASSADDGFSSWRREVSMGERLRGAEDAIALPRRGRCSSSGRTSQAMDALLTARCSRSPTPSRDDGLAAGGLYRRGAHRPRDSSAIAERLAQRLPAYGGHCVSARSGSHSPMPSARSLHSGSFWDAMVGHEAEGRTSESRRPSRRRGASCLEERLCDLATLVDGPPGRGSSPRLAAAGRAGAAPDGPGAPGSSSFGMAQRLVQDPSRSRSLTPSRARSSTSGSLTTPASSPCRRSIPAPLLPAGFGKAPGSSRSCRSGGIFSWAAPEDAASPSSLRRRKASARGDGSCGASSPSRSASLQSAAKVPDAFRMAGGRTSNLRQSADTAWRNLTAFPRSLSPPLRSSSRPPAQLPSFRWTAPDEAPSPAGGPGLGSATGNGYQAVTRRRHDKASSKSSVVLA